MVNDWIIDVLADVQTFASANGLVVAEKAIADAMPKIAEELASMQGIAQGTAHINHVGEFSRTFGGGRNT